MRADVWRRQLLRAPSYLLARAGNTHRAAEILHTIEFGADIGFTGDRSICRHAPNLKSATHNDDPTVAAKVEAQIAADVAEGKKAGPFDTPPFKHYSISPIGAVPKGGSWERIRVIQHLSYPFGGDSINANIADETLELGRFDDACAFIRRAGAGCYLTKLDVAAAYKQVPVRRRDRALLGSKWNGKYYFELVLPFGLKSSGVRWELFAAALHYFFQHHLGIELVIHYVDDFLFVTADYELARSQLAAALRLCEELGVPIAVEKAEGPVTCLTFLGIELDTMAMEMRLPEVKLAALRQLLSTWVHKQRCTITELQSLTGKLHWAGRVVRPGRAWTRRLVTLSTMLERQRAAGGDSEHTLHALTPNARADIRWWHRFIERWNGHSLLYELQWQESHTDLQLFTDACCDEQGVGGFGAVYGNRWIQGSWSPVQLQQARRKLRYSIPFLELYALVLAVCTWGHEWRGRRIRIRCDAQAVVHPCNTLSSKDSSMQALIRHLSTTAGMLGFEFRVVHIVGETNTVADLLSRCVPVPLDQLRLLLPDARPEPDPFVHLPPLQDM
jgi:hypothetical protein